MVVQHTQDIVLSSLKNPSQIFAEYDQLQMQTLHMKSKL